MSLSIMQQDKNKKVWNETHEYQYIEKISLYDSMTITLNRVAKKTRKQPCYLENESRKDALYRLMEFGLFYIEYDLMQILCDLYHKITHIPTKEKIIRHIKTLMGDYNAEEPLSPSSIQAFSLISSLTSGTAFEEYETIWNEDKSDIIDIKVSVQDEKLAQYNDAEVKDVIDFCIKEYRKTIRFIQKCMRENEITCEIVGNCYLNYSI